MSVAKLKNILISSPVHMSSPSNHDGTKGFTHTLKAIDRVSFILGDGIKQFMVTMSRIVPEAAEM